MLNAFEHQAVRKSKLPESWRDEGVLDELERFLQENWRLRRALYTDNELTERQQFIDFDRREGFKTTKYIGTVRFHGEQLNVFPKIYKEDEDDYDTSELKTEDMLKDLVLCLEGVLQNPEKRVNGGKRPGTQYDIKSCKPQLISFHIRSPRFP